MVHQEIRERIKDKLKAVQSFENSVQEYKGLIEAQQKVRGIREQELKDLFESQKGMKILLDHFSNESWRILKDLFNKGIKSIFFDEDYAVDIEIRDLSKRMAKLYLVTKVVDEDGTVHERKDHIPSEVGGGVHTVVSFLYRIFLIKLYDKRRVVVMDEPFTNLSSRYVGTFFKFLRYLMDEMGFTFFFITNDERFLPFMDYEFLMNKGKIVNRDKFMSKKK